MFISPAMSPVVTFGAPRRLKSARLTSRIRSRVRRGRFFSAMANSGQEDPPSVAGRRGARGHAPTTERRLRLREPALEMVERVRKIARGLPHRSLASRTRMKRPRVGESVGRLARGVCQAIHPERDTMLREFRSQF